MFKYCISLFLLKSLTHSKSLLQSVKDLHNYVRSLSMSPLSLLSVESCYVHFFQLSETFCHTLESIKKPDLQHLWFIPTHATFVIYFKTIFAKSRKDNNEISQTKPQKHVMSALWTKAPAHRLSWRSPITNQLTRTVHITYNNCRQPSIIVPRSLSYKLLWT